MTRHNKPPAPGEATPYPAEIDPFDASRGGWATVSAERAAQQLAARGADLATARAAVADYLRGTSRRVGVPAYEWGLDQGDIDALAADAFLCGLSEETGERDDGFEGGLDGGLEGGAGWSQ